MEVIDITLVSMLYRRFISVGWFTVHNGDLHKSARVKMWLSLAISLSRWK